MQGLEEDTEIIGENFTMHFTKYAKRPIINELPRNYINRMAPKGRRSRAGRKKKPANNDECIPETVEVIIIIFILTYFTPAGDPSISSHPIHL